MSSIEVQAKFTHRPETRVLDEATLRANLAEISTGFLLPIAIHVTGDHSLFEKYSSKLPRPQVRQLITAAAEMAQAGETEDLGTEAQEALTELIVETLTSENQAEYLTGHELAEAGTFAKLLNFAGGWDVPKRDHGMYLQQSGFEIDEVLPRTPEARDRKLSVGIIGAGMQGIDAAVRARLRDFEVDLYDKQDRVGGLWSSQVYPGVAVDTQSLAYSLSWGQSAEWSKIFPRGDEYRSYLDGLVAEYGLTDKVHYGHDVTSMEWLEDAQQWELSIVLKGSAKQIKVRHDAIISAAGLLNRPKYPDVDGIDSFAGTQVHTVRWEDIDVEGKNVGIVGAGSAAVQVVHSIADKTKNLTVFQRQPHWVSPNPYGGSDVSDADQWMLRNVPYYMHWMRLTALAVSNKVAAEMSIVDLEYRAENPNSVSKTGDEIRDMCLAYIDKVFGLESEMGKKLTPKFAFGAKRPVWDPGDYDNGDGYYYALSQPHVDVETSGLARVIPQGIVTKAGEVIELDVIIWASGMTLDYLNQIHVVGRDGRVLSREWNGNEDPKAYLGGAVHGFPNLFIMDGPNTGVALGGGGHNFITEIGDHFALQVLSLMVNEGATSIDVTKEAFDEHQDLVAQKLLDTIWEHERGANTYYRNQAGRVVLTSPFLPGEIWNMTRTPDKAKFDLRYGDNPVSKTEESLVGASAS